MNLPKETPEIAYLCKLIQESAQLPVFYYVQGHTQTESFRGADHPGNPLFSDPKELIRSLVEQAGEAEGPVIRMTDYMEHYIALPVKREDPSRAFVVIGPCIDHSPTDETIRISLSDLGISYRDQPRWTAYWRGLPVVSRLRLAHIAALAHWTANRETADVMDILQKSYSSILRKAPMENVEMTLTSSRESALFHSGIEREKLMFGLIRKGDKDELIKRMIDIRYEGVGVLSKRSQLRSVKNLAICAVALGMRAAVEGGIYEELGYTLSDLHIQHIEELNDAKAVEAAMINALLDFTERVRQSRQRPVSKPVRACKEYIYNHLYEEITMRKLSELTGINGNYLSQMFKKETGTTFTHYLQRERVEEAKKLLDHTRDTISAIGSRLCFYDEAHFVKVFKKHAGMTPKRYRNRNPMT